MANRAKHEEDFIREYREKLLEEFNSDHCDYGVIEGYAGWLRVAATAYDIYKSEARFWGDIAESDRKREEEKAQAL